VALRRTDPRTEHLIYLVEEGATLAEAGQIYGIGRERVRQILQAEGIEVSALPNRGEMRRSRRLALRRTLAPAMEAMWRGGMTAAEIADALEIPTRTVRELIRERVPADERNRRAAEIRRARRLPDQSMIKALRKAAQRLGRTPGRAAYDRLRGEGLVEGPSGDAIAYRWGSWALACEAAELKPNSRPPHLGLPTYSEDEYRGALRRVAEEVGDPPTQAQYRAARRNGEPSVHAVNLRFGGWLNARRELLSSVFSRTRREEAAQRITQRVLGAALVWAVDPGWWQGLSSTLAA
jgi:hypothetical protein